MTDPTWTSDDWSLLSQRIANGSVTPMLGAGASNHIIGSTNAVANKLAERALVPFAANEPLDRVAQYAARVDRDMAGEELQEMFTSILTGFVVADIDDPHHIYRYLTGLSMPVWLTTNYDDLIRRGLAYNNKMARVAVARWTPPDVYWDGSDDELDGFEPSVDQPLVFHVHGRYGDVRSMVISESDYLEYHEQMAATPGELLPDVVQSRIAGSSMLFVGYGFNDSNFHLLLREWKTTKLCYAVQPSPPRVSGDDLVQFTPYYESRLRALTKSNIKVFWGTASEFCRAHAESEAP